MEGEETVDSPTQETRTTEIIPPRRVSGLARFLSTMYGPIFLFVSIPRLVCLYDCE